MMFAVMMVFVMFQPLNLILHFRYFALEFLDGNHGLIVNLLLIDINSCDGSDLGSVLGIMKNNLEPEPVEDLKTTDQGESCEESKHTYEGKLKDLLI